MVSSPWLLLRYKILGLKAYGPMSDNCRVPQYVGLPARLFRSFGRERPTDKAAPAAADPIDGVVATMRASQCDRL